MYKSAYRLFWTTSNFTLDLKLDEERSAFSQLAVPHDKSLNRISNIVVATNFAFADANTITITFARGQDCWVGHEPSSKERSGRPYYVVFRQTAGGEIVRHSSWRRDKAMRVARGYAFLPIVEQMACLAGSRDSRWVDAEG